MNISTLSTTIAALFLAAAMPAAGQGFAVQTSDSLTALGRAWAKGFSAKSDSGTIEVKSANTPDVFDALSKKAVQAAITPRAIRYPELQACEKTAGTRPTEYKLAVNGVAILVPPQNSVKEVSYQDLVGIFSGKLRDWKELGGVPGPIHAYGVETNSSVGELFLEEVMSGKSLARDIRFVSGNDLVNAVATDEAAIAFSPLVQDGKLRALAIKRVYSSTPVEPSPEAISNRIYPISRFVFGYAFGQAEDPNPFLSWIRSDEGQKLAVQLGYYQLPPKWRPKL